MKFIDLEILPKGDFGWSSGTIKFAKNITQFYGPNGTGKTPVIQSLAFCLGFPSQFRKDIFENCEKARLTVDFNGKEIVFERPYVHEFYIKTIEIESEKENEFYNEADVSEYIYTLIGIPERYLVSKSKTRTPLYFSLIFPFFYLDQDFGYTSIYSARQNFVKDQFSEAVRVLFEIPAKNSFNAKKGKIKAEKELKFWEDESHERKKSLEIVKESTSSDSTSRAKVTSLIERYSFELDAAKSNAIDYGEIDQSFSEIIGEISSQVRILDRELLDIKVKIESVNAIVNEIDDEINTLNLNEEARRAFIDFGEICPNSSCGLFSQSNEAYTKSLLYLKDQIKDLLRNKELDIKRVNALEKQRAELKQELDSVIDKRNQAIRDENRSPVIALVSELGRKLYDAKSQLSDIAKIENFERRYVEALNERERAASNLASFGKESGQTQELVAIRVRLAEFLVKWLTIIKAPNLSFDITFRHDFEPIFGQETIGNLKGSTKTRVVLAFHVALMETLLSFGHRPMPFLIFDTPKQQETNTADLKSFFNEVKRLSSANNLQVIFSTSEYRYEGNHDDVELNPEYAEEGRMMYLKNPKYA